MTVDILLPFYGDVGHLKEAVLSVMSQTDDDWRLIVVDDGYPDPHVREWFSAIEDGRVTYRRNPENLGPNGNYRESLKFVESDLVTIMGADDIMLPNYVETVRSTFAATDATVVQPGVLTIDSEGHPSHPLTDRVKDFYAPPRGERVSLSGSEMAASLIKANWTYFPSLAWRAEAILGTGFRTQYSVMQDLALLLDIAKAGGVLVYEPTVTFLYRRHSASDSSAKALSGVRFTEERDFFETFGAEMRDLGWGNASRAARVHLSSRFHAAALLPNALRTRDVEGARRLIGHVTGIPALR